MIHLSIGEIQRDTKTACKQSCESLPRSHASVEYRNRMHVTCELCAAAARRIESLRNDKRLAN